MSDCHEAPRDGFDAAAGRLRILLVALSFDPAHRHGGPTVVNLAVASGLAKLDDLEVAVLTTNAGGSGGSTLSGLPNGWVGRPEGFKVRYCRAGRAREWSWEMLLALPGCVRRADCVRLVSAFGWIVPVTMLLALLFGKPVLWMPHGAIQETMIRQSRPKLKTVWIGFLRLLARGLRMRAVVPSSSELDAFRRFFPETRAVLIPHGIVVPGAPPRKIPARDGRLRLTVMCRLVPQKGVDRLIRALAGTKTALRLDIYGEGPEMEGLRALTRQSGLQDIVEFHGFVAADRHEEIFARTDLLVSPALWDAYGMVVLEALAHSVPVLASTGSPWSELEARGCGFWRDVTPASLASAIDEAASRDLPAMGAKGLQWVRENFSWDKAVCKEAELIRSLCGGDR